MRDELHPVVDPGGLSALQDGGCAGGGGEISLRGKQPVRDPDLRGLSAAVDHLILNENVRALRAGMGRGKEDPVRRGMDGFLHRQGYLPGDAGAGKPPGIGNVAVVHADGEDVVPVKMELFRDVIGEGNIAVGAAAEIVAVAPDTAVLVDPVEANGDPFAPPFLSGRHADAVPADAPRQITGAAGIFPGKGQGDGPVVGQADLLPAGIVKPRLPGVRGIPQVKTASVIQCQDQFVHKNLRCGTGASCARYFSILYYR